MHCKTCDYPLWNITSNKCPECGESFRPSDYEFVPNSVRFCCPNCQQTYYGTGIGGHLEPSEFACVSCSNQINMDQMVLLPAEGVEENWTKPDVNPWIERKSRGLFRAWLASVISCLVRPSSMMKSLGDVARVGDACKFALFNLAIILTIGIGLPGGIIILFQLFWRTSSRVISALEKYAIILIVYAIIYILCIFLWAALTHGILRLTKCAKFKFGKTTEAILYSSGVMAPMAIPLVGIYCGSIVTLIWWTVSSVIMVSVAQKIRGGRASFAVLTLPAIVLVLVFAFFGIAFFSISQLNMASSAARMRGVNAYSTYNLKTDILAFARKSNGVTPAHTILLLENPNSTGSASAGRWITRENQFVSSMTATMLEDIPVGDITLADFQVASKTQRQAAVKIVLDSMPDNVIAHRFGDYVFTYHGLDLAADNQGLWVVVALPDPDINGALQPNQSIEVKLMDKNAHWFSADQLIVELQDQNKMRAKVGLPPLPDLTTVTHSNPAVADSEDSSD